MRRRRRKRKKSELAKSPLRNPNHNLEHLGPYQVWGNLSLLAIPSNSATPPAVTAFPQGHPTLHLTRIAPHQTPPAPPARIIHVQRSPQVTLPPLRLGHQALATVLFRLALAARHLPISPCPPGILSLVGAVRELERYQLLRLHLRHLSHSLVPLADLVHGHEWIVI